VFPDCAKNERQYCGRDPSPEEIQYVLRNIVHKTFHFTNSPLQERSYRPGGIGTSETDIVQMINYAVAKLKGGKPYIYEVKLTNTEAVWLLAHLVGDIHQPLHVGQVYFDKTCANRINPNENKGVEILSTFGGNRIKLDPSTGADNLHFFWDGAAVRKAMSDDGAASEEAFAERLAATKPAPGWEQSHAPERWAEKWVAEIMPIADDAHAHGRVSIDGKVGKKPSFPSTSVTCEWSATLKPGYEKWAADHAREQLRKAGHRLAALYVAIFSDH
jgi:hypothetical protein